MVPTVAPRGGCKGLGWRVALQGRAPGWTPRLAPRQDCFQIRLVGMEERKGRKGTSLTPAGPHRGLAGAEGSPFCVEVRIGVHSLIGTSYWEGDPVDTSKTPMGPCWGERCALSSFSLAMVDEISTSDVEISSAIGTQSKVHPHTESLLLGFSW